MGWESSDVVRFCLGPLLQGQTMIHWLWLVVVPVDTNLYRFSDGPGLVLFTCILRVNVPCIY